MAGFNIEEAQKAINSGIEEGMTEETQKIANNLRKIINNSWEGKQLSSIEKEEFKELVKDPGNRKIFCGLINNYRKQGTFLIPANCFASVAELLCEFLDYINPISDIPITMTIVLLSSTFYSEQKNSEGKLEKIYLQQALVKRNYLKDEEFWKKVLDYPLGENNKPTLEPEKPEEKKQREVNELFSRLTTYAHDMILFEMDNKFVEQIIFEYAKSHGLSEQYLESFKVYTSLIVVFN